MPGIDYRAVRADLCLAEVLELIGYQPRTRQADQLRGPCPLHGSRSRTSRSFAAHLGKNVYHCFRCGAGGNALDLWAALSRLPLAPARGRARFVPAPGPPGAMAGSTAASPRSNRL